MLRYSDFFSFWAGGGRDWYSSAILGGVVWYICIGLCLDTVLSRIYC